VSTGQPSEQLETKPGINAHHVCGQTGAEERKGGQQGKHGLQRGAIHLKGQIGKSGMRWHRNPFPAHVIALASTRSVESDHSHCQGLAVVAASSALSRPFEIPTQNFTANFRSQTRVLAADRQIRQKLPREIHSVKNLPDLVGILSLICRATTRSCIDRFSERKIHTSRALVFCQCRHPICSRFHHSFAGCDLPDSFEPCLQRRILAFICVEAAKLFKSGVANGVSHRSW